MENSKILLTYALKALKEAKIENKNWTIGGGTILAKYYNHRYSKDIDIFINDPQYLSALSPRLNNTTESALDYNEMSSYISLTYPEGKIDFINSNQITKYKPQKKIFNEEKIYIEDPVEIVIKKLFYRGSFALPRDIFDLAIVYNSNRKQDLIKELIKIQDKTTTFFKKIKDFDDKNLYSNNYKENILEGGKYLIGKELIECNKIKKIIISKKKSQQLER